MRFWIITSMFLIVFAGLSQAYAAGGGPGGPPQPPAGKGPPPTIPIDGGIGLLLAAGIAFGSRKLYKSFKDRG